MQESPVKVFYILSVKHTSKYDPYITLWNPDNKGYCYRSEVAGRYTKEHVERSLNYYHSGDSDIAVACNVIDSMLVLSHGRYLDIHGSVLPNTEQVWEYILESLCWIPRHTPDPEYYGKTKYARSTICR